MALFGLNWEESKWPVHFCYIVLHFFASKIGVKLPPEKNVPWHRCWALLSSRWKSHFSPKKPFFGQKEAFFQKVHFIQIWSVTPNTIFECIKNDFLLYNLKLVFFTEFNLMIFDVGGVIKPYRRCGQSSSPANPAVMPQNFLRELVEVLGCVGRT